MPVWFGRARRVQEETSDVATVAIVSCPQTCPSVLAGDRNRRSSRRVPSKSRTTKGQDVRRRRLPRFQPAVALAVVHCLGSAKRGMLGAVCDYHASGVDNVTLRP
jgi:hypothetical protein